MNDKFSKKQRDRNQNNWIPEARNLDIEKKKGLKSLDDSIRFRYGKTEQMLNIDLVAQDMPEDVESIRLSELLTGRKPSKLRQPESDQKRQPKIDIEKKKVEKGRYDELRFEDKVIGFAMPKGEFSSGSDDDDPTKMYSGAENCV